MNPFRNPSPMLVDLMFRAAIRLRGLSELDAELRKMGPVVVPEGWADRTWDRITETIRADEGALHVPLPEDGGITGTCERWHPAASHDSSPGAVAVTAPGGGGVTP